MGNEKENRTRCPHTLDSSLWSCPFCGIVDVRNLKSAQGECMATIKNQKAFEEFPFHHNQMPFRAGFIEKGFHFPLHYHDAVEIIVLTRGSLLVEVNHQKYDLHPGDWLTIGSHHMHAYEKCSKDAQFYLVLMAADLFQGLSHYEDLFLLMSPYLYQVTRGTVKSGEEACPQLLMSMVGTYESQIPGYELDMVFLFLQLIKQLGSTEGVFLKNQDQNQMNVQDPELHKWPVQHYDFVKGFHHVLFTRYMDGLTLGLAADLMGFSPFHFTRKFRQIMGMGFKDYVNRFMIKRAAIDLEHTSQTITEIALNHGFNSAKTFHRVFVHQYGKSPSSYRRAINGKSTAISDRP